MIMGKCLYYEVMGKWVKDKIPKIWYHSFEVTIFFKKFKVIIENGFGVYFVLNRHTDVYTIYSIKQERFLDELDDMSKSAK